jgi:Putative transposase
VGSWNMASRPFSTLAAEQPVLASCYAASAADVQLLGAAPGKRTDKLVRRVRAVASPKDALAEHGGVNVHANTAVDGRDRKRLERLVRYVARPPLSQERLELHDDGRVRLRFKAPWKDGTDAILLSPLDFISRLCALTPPPRFCMIRYHGVLASHASARNEVVPGRSPVPGQQLPLFNRTDAGPLAPPPSRHPWAFLLRRVFSTDIRVCPDCGGSMLLVTIATTPAAVARVLQGRAPRARAPPPLPGQLALDFVAA